MGKHEARLEIQDDDEYSVIMKAAREEDILWLSFEVLAWGFVIAIIAYLIYAA